MMIVLIVVIVENFVVVVMIVVVVWVMPILVIVMVRTVRIGAIEACNVQQTGVASRVTNIWIGAEI